MEGKSKYRYSKSAGNLGFGKIEEAQMVDEIQRENSNNTSNRPTTVAGERLVKQKTGKKFLKAVIPARSRPGTATRPATVIPLKKRLEPEPFRLPSSVIQQPPKPIKDITLIGECIIIFYVLYCSM